MIYVKVKDGAVVDRAVFAASMPADWPERAAWVASDAAQIGWSYAGGQFEPPIVVKPPVDLVAYAARKRWEKETCGTTFAGIPVPTDDRAKLLIFGAAQSLADDASTPFIAAGKNHGALTGAQFKALNAAIVAHTQATFAALATVLAGIAAGTVTTTDQIDAAF